MSLYELAVLGDATDVQRSQLATTVQEMVTDFGLRIDVDVVVHDGGSIGGRDRHAAFAAVYFGGDPNKDLAAVDELIQTSAPIIPTIARGAEFSSQIPSQLHFANGLRRTDDPKMTALAAALLECVGFGCVGELSMADAIFLSASVPDPRRSSRFAETADSVAITAAVTALMYVSLGRRMLVWGGHPAITPMIWVAAESMDVDYATWVKLYQSKFFEDDFPEENARFGNVVFVDTVDNDRGTSLRLMRDRMFREQQFQAAVFIGGMDGILDEYELFHRYQPRAEVVPVASTGGAALELANRLASPAQDLREDLDYVALFHRHLHIQTRERRFRKPVDQPAALADRLYDRRG